LSTQLLKRFEYLKINFFFKFKSAIKGTDTVMEVGSGTGNMSLKIMQRAKKLIAFEIDQKMVAELQKRIIGT